MDLGGEQAGRGRHAERAGGGRQRAGVRKGWLKDTGACNRMAGTGQTEWNIGADDDRFGIG